MEKKPMEESGSTGVGGNEDDLVFPGFRFHPTDQELVGFYLKRKVERKGFSIDIIKEIDVYKHDPWDLPSEAWPVVLAQGGAGEKEWYFFCLRGRKYRNSIRPNRVTGSGFWKATGIDKPIHDGGECVGLKKSLVYYVGSAGKGTKTDWMMHEFRLRAATSSVDFHDAEMWTVCRIFKRNSSYTRRLLQPQQKQDHSGSSTKRSHQLQQKQLDQYYYGYLRHQHHYAGCASMASSFKSTTTDLSEAHHATLHCQPFQLHGFHEVSPEDVTETKTSSTVGTSSPSASGWSELTSFVPDAGSTCWDELGRILEISPRI